MTKYLLYTGLAIISAQAVFALQITEIMYDPEGSDTGYEWIEIYNDSQATVDMTKLKLLEAGVKHGISLGIGGATLDAGEYAVISSDPAKFQTANSAYTGKVLDSVYSLSNTGESFSIIDSAGNTLASATYISNEIANGTGGTLNLDNGAWVGYGSTPGKETERATVILKSNTSSNSVSNTSSTTSTSSASVQTATVANGYVSVGRGAYTLGEISILTAKEVQGVVGSDTHFSVLSVNTQKPVTPTNTYWSFGDGSEGRGATTTHRYVNPGIYIAFVECEVPNGYGIDMITVNIIMPDISITQVGDGYIKIKNNSTTTDINIGGFYISSDQGVYKLSRHLLLKSEQEMKLDGRVLGFSNLTNVRLLSSAMNLISVYRDIDVKPVIAPTSTITKVSVSKKIIKTPLSSTAKKVDTKTVSIKSVNVIGTYDNILAADMKSGQALLQQNTTATRTQVTETVYSSSIKKGKNWLYWLYEQ